MENSYVTKLNAVINNPNLEVLLEGYKDWAKCSSNGQYVKLVGAGLPITQFNTGIAKIRCNFYLINNATTGALFGGIETVGGTLRICVNRRYVADSSGTETAEFVSCFGNGAIESVGTLTKNKKYTLECTSGYCKIFDENDDIVINHTYGSGSSGILNIVEFGLFYPSSSSRPEMFKVYDLSIINLDQEILHVVPIDKDGFGGCLYDTVNNQYYYPDSGMLTVGND